MDAATAERFAQAQAIARSAGAVLLEHYGRLGGYRHKGDVNLVTEADRASEELIAGAIRAAFPGDAILGEEGAAAEGSSGFEWIVDPLDGTTNFVHGYPYFMVSIGLLLHRRRVAGVCYGPFYGELFTAARGQGAARNGDPIRVSTVPDLRGSLLGTGFPYNRREIVDELLAKVGRAICSSHGLRRAGSAAYDLCSVAAGRLDGFFEQSLLPWDLAAGTLLIEEAGGRVSMYDGSPFDLFGDTILASNGIVHDELRRVVIEGEPR